MYVNSLHPKDLQAELGGGIDSSPFSSTSFERPQDEGEGKERRRESGKNLHRDHHHHQQHHPHLKDLKAGVKEKRGGEKKGKWKARSSKSNCNRARYLKIFEVI